jgi:hypothetical protein
MTGDEATGTV